MSIISSVTAIRRQERGWDDPGYPIAIWTVVGSVLGDASGGQKRIQVNLASPGTPVGLAYSIETIDVESSETDDLHILIEAVNFDATQALGVSRHIDLTSSAATGVTIATVGIAAGLQRPWFLGVAVDPTVSAAVTLQTQNGDGDTVLAALAGYLWDPRSVLQAPGGYRRPPDGMFGI